MAEPKLDVESLRGRRATARWNRVSMGDIWERVRWSRPDDDVLVAGPGATEGGLERLTFAQADDLANQVAHALLERARPGDVAVLVCENSVEAVVTKVGMAKAGVIVAPLNPNLAPDVVAEVLQRIEPTLAVVDAQFLDRAAPLLAEAGVPLGAVIAVGGERAPDVPTFAELVAGRPTSEPEVEIHGDDIWQLLFTSGTSASPKAAMSSHTNTMMNALGFTGLVTHGARFESEAVVASFLPVIYHVADVVAFATFLGGGRVVIGRGVDFGVMAETLAAEEVTALWGGMPTMLAALAATAKTRPELSLASLRTIIFGWAPPTTELFDAITDMAGHEVDMVEIIGMTEVVVAHRFWLNQNDDLFRRTAPAVNFVGHPHPLLAAAIVAEDGSVVDVGADQPGEARYRSPALMAGYYRNAEGTREAFEGGWFHTGDQFQYGEGTTQRAMVDRLKDVVKSGGENVSSIRVEAALDGHPGVTRSAVVGIPHERWGEAVTAAVIPADPADPPTEEDLVAHCKARLAPYEVPKRVVIVESLPQAVGGKLQKHRIRDLLRGAYSSD